MKEITLTQGKVAIVDDDDFEQLNAFKWYAIRNSRNYLYAARGVWEKGKARQILMHRVIMNTPIGMLTDHVNGNSLDNRKENLRICTNQQNLRNRKNPNKNNKLEIKGVHWCQSNKKFQATIQVNGKTIHLGFYNVLGDADSAYRFAEEKHFGIFARNC